MTDRDAVTPQPDYSVIYLSSIDWAFRKQDHQFIATEFAARGHPVLFVENTGARLPAARDVARVLARLRNWSRRPALPPSDSPAGIRMVSPLCIPGATSRIERAINRAMLRVQVGSTLGHVARRPVILWIALPTWAAIDVAEQVRPDLIVYYCGDAFTQLPGLRPAIAASEREIARRADVVFATSGRLVEHCRHLGATPQLVPVAIDLEASRSAREGRVSVPSDLGGLRGRLIGYMGGLNYKVDVALLDAVSSHFPDDTLVILGSVEDPKFAPRASRNVVILGERPYERIGAYLARFDVCLIPYRINEYTAGVNPAKLLEYLAVGRPVVSTPLPEVKEFQDVVRVAATTGEFIEAIAEIIEHPENDAARAARISRVSTHSYDRIVAGLVDRIDRSLMQLRSGTSEA